jgi:hypothetical protein
MSNRAIDVVHTDGRTGRMSESRLAAMREHGWTPKSEAAPPKARRRTPAAPADIPADPATTTPGVSPGEPEEG